jgi:GMP synthase (glutamine-hydrolysing)
MLDDRGAGSGVCRRAGESLGARPFAGREAGEKLPVVIVLHQPHSTPGHIGHWFERNGHALDIRRPRYGDALPGTLERHCGAVIFGGPMSANDTDDFIRQETDWIGVALAEKKPFLGVCLGAQMLCRLLGGTVAFDPQGRVEIGYHPIRPTPAGKRLGAWPETVYQWHREGFDIPASCVPLAMATDNGAFQNQAFSYGETAFGVQFHPEITNAQVYRWTGYNPHRLTAEGAQPQPDQLRDHLIHGPRVRDWLDRFLGGWVRGALAPGH